MMTYAIMHAKYSPSNLEALALCPGRANIGENYPDQRSLASIEGTHRHTLRELCIKERRSAAEWLDMEIEDHDGKFKVNWEMITDVNNSLKHIWSILNHYPDAYVGAEVRVTTEIPDCWGTADLIIHTDDFVMIDDAKFGSFPVYPKDNWQGIAYFLGYVNSQDVNVREDLPVRISISQPKHQVEPKVWETTAGELLGRKPEIASIIEAASTPNAPRIPGNKQCQFCKGKNDCPERNQWRSKAVTEAFNEIDIEPKGEMVTGFDLPPVAEMSNASLGKYLDLESIVIGWFKDIKAEGIRRAEAGQKFPDHKLVRVSAKRRYIEDLDVIQKALKGMGLKKAEYIEEKLMSFTKVLANPKLTDRQRARVEKELLIKPQGSLRLVPESDERQAVVTSAEDGFSGVHIEQPAKEESPKLSFDFM
jgi:hypothetical protein